MEKRADCSVDNRPGERSKNKRKLAHPSILPSNISSSLVEFSRYESSTEISQSSKAEFSSSRVGSDRFLEEPEVHMHELADWNDPIASPLEELLLSNLQAVFLSAIKQIVEFGYSEDVAEKAISRKGLYLVEGDPVSNIVHDAVNILTGKDVTTRDIVFENFQHLLHYTMVEMISVLCEVRPYLTVGEAMWLLLICDLNMSQACALEEGHLSGFGYRGESSASSLNPPSKSEIQSSDMILSTCCTPNIENDSSPSHQNNMSVAPKFGSFLNSPNNQSPLAPEGAKLEAENGSLPYTAEESSGTSRECIQAASQLPASEGKPGPISKRYDRKEIAALRKKFLDMEKTYRACGKGGFKSGKPANIGGFVVDKRLKKPSEIPSQPMKGGSSTIGTIAPSEDGMCQVSTNASSTVPAGDSSKALPAKDAICTPVMGTKNLISDKKPIPMSELSTSDSQETLDYYAGIPYNESLGKYVPQDQKDKLILKLDLQVQKFQDELKSWNGWANQKVMDVARRLVKNHAELNILKKEKQEAELFQKEKKILEENATKRIFEMENAVANVTSQIESANSIARTLEVENSVLKKELGAAKLWAVKSMASHQQALEREQMSLKKAQSCESQKGLLLDELEREKHKLANLQQKVHEEKSLQVKVEGRLEQERVVKEKLLAQAASIKKEREQLEARAKVEEDMIRKKAAHDMQKYVEDISKLEKELAELKLKYESEKIAALRRGIEGRNDSCSRFCKSTPTGKGKRKSDVSRMMESFHDNLADGSLRREQECVMCLSEKMSVVFLPCAHQVVCANCNELHGKQGMKDCPSCRTPIQRRIHARFAGQ